MIPHESKEMRSRPTLEVVKQTIGLLKSNKELGNDSIRTKFIKLGTDQLHIAIPSLLKCIWKSETLPEEQHEGIIIIIDNKGDRSICKNYMSVTVLIIMHKELSNMYSDISLRSD